MTAGSSGEPVVSSIDGAVVTITIDRPERRNALSPAVVRGLYDALTAAEAEPSVSVAVLTGAGDRAFCAGGDLSGMGATSKKAQHLERGEVGGLFRRLQASRLPVVARVNGHALAGGFGLMLSCDLVVAADDAELGMPEVNVGLWPFMVAALVQRDVPRKVALDLMLTGRRIPASEGERWGFVNRVVPRDGLDASVAELTQTLTSKSPLVLSLGKSSYYAAEDMEVEQKLAYLNGMLSLCLESEDAVEGVTAFLQKRPPEWKGR
ncbi:MAG TPA: enoyl-CoA hydratase-related protein [Actinomycetota bacterium]|nr:enoyl-CoA hydratase-related protein [Actinomycetota bacterium]